MEGRTLIKWVNTWCEEWGTWMAGHLEQSAIGYPRETIEARAGQQADRMPSHAICPEVMMPPRVSALDRIVSTQPREWGLLCWRIYVWRDHAGRRDYDRIHVLHNRIEAVHLFKTG